MTILEYLRQPDIRPFYAVGIQSIPGVWVPIGEVPAGVSSYQSVIVPDSIELRGAQIKVFDGLGMNGSLSLKLCDPSGYLAGLVAPGVEDFLASQIEPDSVTFELEFGAAITSPAHVHNEAIAFTLAGTTATIVTRNLNDGYGYPCRHTWRGTEEGAGRGQAVRVGSTPYTMEGRWISVIAYALDQAGLLVLENGAPVYGEVWRGKITSWPESVDDVNFSLEAETLESAIVDSPPLCGFKGHIATGTDFGVYANLLNQPVLIQAGRGRIGIRVSWYTIGIEEFFAEMPVGWCSIRDIADALTAAAIAFGGFADKVTLGATAPTEGGRRLTCGVRLTGALTTAMFSIIDDGGLAAQLGFSNSGFGEANQVVPSPGPVRGTEAPAQVFVMPYDSVIPVIAEEEPPQVPGTILIGEEAVAYATATQETIGGVGAYLLGGCQRGLCGTPRQTLVYRYGAEGEDLPTIEGACLAGVGTSGAAEANIWIPILKLLTGIGIAGNYNGIYSDGPGLGISADHIDVPAFVALAVAPGAIASVQGVVADIRKFIADAMALEGYALAGSTAGTYYKLRPVWIGALSAVESSIPVRFAMGGTKQLRAGTGEIINVLELDLPDGTKATFYDDDSIQQFGMQQSVGYELPMSGLASAYMITGVVARMFHLRGRRSTKVAEADVASEGRYLQPGEVVTLTWPRAALTGTWRVLGCNQPMAGAGKIRITALKVDGNPQYIYAPTCEALTAVGTTLTLVAGHGVWFVGVSQGWLYNPDDYSDGLAVAISAVVGDVLTVDTVGGAGAGWLLEPISQERTEYAYIDDTMPAVWGS